MAVMVSANIVMQLARHVAAHALLFYFQQTLRQPVVARQFVLQRLISSRSR
ncbi:hypothetical protein ACNKHQ_21890 [Shigella flexneri]